MQIRLSFREQKKSQSRNRCEVRCTRGLICGLDTWKRAVTWVNSLSGFIITISPCFIKKGNEAKHCQNALYYQNIVTALPYNGNRHLSQSTTLFFNNTLPSVLLPAEKLHLPAPMTKEIVWHRDSVILALNHTDPFNQQKKKAGLLCFCSF